MTAELDLVGGEKEGWMHRWMDGVMGVTLDLKDCCLWQFKKTKT
jgi:hypothetical protein